MAPFSGVAGDTAIQAVTDSGGSKAKFTEDTAQPRTLGPGVNEIGKATGVRVKAVV